MALPLAPTIAARFPLVARKRPPAKPLDARISRLAGLAETAHREGDSEKASMVFNGAALVASDCADAELARTWCHRHANLYLSKAPLDGYTGRFALEPVVNLARLRLRAHDGQGAHRLLTDLYDAVVNSSPTVIDDLEILPWQLPAEPSEREQITNWLCHVLLADGTRALTLAGRWTEAVTHVQRYGGIEANLLDGRQVGVVANLLQGNGPAATAILNQSTIEHPWEEPVRGLLHSWIAAALGDRHQADQPSLINQVSGLVLPPGLGVFRTRLSLTVLDLAADVSPAVGACLVNCLVTAVVREQDANPARELLNHPAVGAEHHEALKKIIAASGLGVGLLPQSARRTLSMALDLAGIAIHEAHLSGRNSHA
ncbi:hypothetical protein AB0D32_03780 [Micromonospora sp. NPDC048170]|uniref:hypothetical protein n=1 Tax=Micromonospora sp. NPDC048170 TaxID=3154819 RepID=UPI0033E06622